MVIDKKTYFNLCTWSNLLPQISHANDVGLGDAEVLSSDAEPCDWPLMVVSKYSLHMSVICRGNLDSLGTLPVGGSKELEGRFDIDDRGEGDAV